MKTQTNRIRDEKGNPIADDIAIQKTVRGYCAELFTNKLENLEEIYKFQDNWSQPKEHRKWELTNIEHAI